MGDETKHKGATKGDGGLAICACYDDEELIDDERSGGKELREGENEMGDLIGGNEIQFCWQGCHVTRYM